MLGRKTRAAYISILRITSGTIYGINREGKTLYRWLHIVSLVWCISSKARNKLSNFQNPKAFLLEDMEKN